MKKTPAQMLSDATNIAVVGASRSIEKSAGAIPLSMQAHGWNVIPVNPHVDSLYGVRAYRSLEEIEEPVDIVNVFRPSEDAPAIARQAVAIGARGLWLQSGVFSPEARRIAEEAGLDYVEDRCMAVERALHRLDKRGPGTPEASA